MKKRKRKKTIQPERTKPLRRFTPGRVERMYDNWSERYDGEFTENGWQGPLETYLAVSDIFNLYSGAVRLLDVGIGTGLSSEVFKSMRPDDLHITGVDISREMLEQARKKQAAHELIQHDFQAAGLPFENESFDVVVSCGVFELLNYPEDVIEEMGRVLRPSGAFAFTVYADSPQKYSCFRHSDDVIEKALRDAGLGDYKKERFFAFNFHGNDIYYHMYSGVKQAVRTPK